MFKSKDDRSIIPVACHLLIHAKRSPLKIIISGTIILLIYLSFLEPPSATSYPIATICLSPLTQRAQLYEEEQPLFPAGSLIPRKIWHKMGPKGISKDAKAWIQTCLSANPFYRHELLTDESGDEYVQSHFSGRPDILSAYFSLKIPILKADLLRYLILYSDGGIWSDLDVSCEPDMPIDSWIPKAYQGKAKLVVGLEYGLENELKRNPHFLDDSQLHVQFASWTIMAAPHLTHVATIIDDIVTSLNDLSDAKSKPISGVEMRDIKNVVDITGPKRMTWSIVKSLSNMMGEIIDDRNLSRLHEPKLFGDVLVLPTNAFAERFEGEGKRLARHHYAGAWKNRHGGERVTGTEGAKLREYQGFLGE